MGLSELLGTVASHRNSRFRKNETSDRAIHSFQNGSKLGENFIHRIFVTRFYVRKSKYLYPLAYLLVKEKWKIDRDNVFARILLQYSAIELGVTGAGGEYNPQTGFGWTNGFLMEIFNTWGKFLKSNEIVS